MENEIMELDREAVAQDLRKALANKFDSAKVDEAMDQILSLTSTRHRADGQIASISAYTIVNCQIRKGQKFVGNAGAVPAIGAGIYTGNVYTKDIDRLYSETVRFEFHLAVFYFGITFWNSSSDFLGHFESGGFSNYINEGGGTGSWS